MSKLDDALDLALTEDPEGNYYLSKPKIKQNVKDLMLEIIGDIELLEENRPGQNMDVVIRNAFKSELRKRINEL